MHLFVFTNFYVLSLDSNLQNYVQYTQNGLFTIFFLINYLWDTRLKQIHKEPHVSY